MESKRKEFNNTGIKAFFLRGLEALKSQFSPTKKVPILPAPEKRDIPQDKLLDRLTRVPLEPTGGFLQVYLVMFVGYGAFNVEKAYFDKGTAEKFAAQCNLEVEQYADTDLMGYAVMSVIVETTKDMVKH